MFQFISCGQNTYYLRCFSNIGVYDLGNGEAVLIDSGDHKKSVSDLDKALVERGLKVKMILNTHGHVDHIHGNRFFKEKYGCPVYAPQIEQYFVEESAVEPTYYYNGIPTNRARNFFFRPLGTACRRLTPDVLPAEFEMLPLPGHSHNMHGFKTPDDVWFLADAVVDRLTFEEYKLPAFMDVNKSIETLRMLETLKGAFFVPSHSAATADIAPLARYNAEMLEQRKAFFRTLCTGKSFEDIFIAACEQLPMTMDLDKYAKISTTVRCFLQSLLEDGTVTARIEGFVPRYYPVQ
ncbi:MAG: MBL fold metallo-hydrolase [Clostridia bacterium]|nr:MBL fold metallo-hydrolase [Clostridia bacterium]